MVVKLTWLDKSPFRKVGFTLDWSRCTQITNVG